MRFRKFYSVCFDATARSQKSKEYSYRIKAESEFKHALDNDWYPLFITLTFSQPMLRIADTDGFNGPGIFLSRFSKDVARTVYGTDRPVGVSKSEYIRYLSVPEFGDLNDRAHYHMLVFVKDLPDYARRCPTAIGRQAGYKDDQIEHMVSHSTLGHKLWKVDRKLSNFIRKHYGSLPDDVCIGDDIGFFEIKPCRLNMGDIFARNLRFNWPMKTDKGGSRLPKPIYHPRQAVSYVTKYISKSNGKIPFSPANRRFSISCSDYFGQMAVGPLVDYLTPEAILFDPQIKAAYDSYPRGNGIRPPFHLPRS